MCREQELAFEIFIKKFYRVKDTFTLQEVEETLLREAKTTRIAPGRTIEDWIKSAVIFGDLEEIQPEVYRRN